MDAWDPHHLRSLSPTTHSRIRHWRSGGKVPSMGHDTALVATPLWHKTLTHLATDPALPPKPRIATRRLRKKKILPFHPEKTSGLLFITCCPASGAWCGNPVVSTRGGGVLACTTPSTAEIARAGAHRALDRSVSEEIPRAIEAYDRPTTPTSARFHLGEHSPLCLDDH
jgi:hypothetical protein